MDNQDHISAASKSYEVFVYGSLKRGFRNHSQLENGTFIGTAVTVEKYYLTSHSYPFLSKSKQHCNVKGECFRVGKELLAQLDSFEGVPYYYTRETIQVVMDDTKKVKDVQVYFCEKARGAKVHDDGHYLEEP